MESIYHRSHVLGSVLFLFIIIVDIFTLGSYEGFWVLLLLVVLYLLRWGLGTFILRVREPILDNKRGGRGQTQHFHNHVYYYDTVCRAMNLSHQYCVGVLDRLGSLIQSSQE